MKSQPSDKASPALNYQASLLSFLFTHRQTLCSLSGFICGATRGQLVSSLKDQATYTKIVTFESEVIILSCLFKKNAVKVLQLKMYIVINVQ